MKLLSNNIYNKIKELDASIKAKLKQKGIVVPIRNDDGSINVGFYKIIKRDGFYLIMDYSDEPVIKNINLPQSAALLANKLALGKHVDTTILNADQRYGHALFEETLQQHLAIKSVSKNKLDNADLMYTKAKISRLKKEHYRNEITRGFENLMRFR